MKGHDVAVIGAGSFGAWCAWCLRQTGRSVLLVDAWGPGHSRASSGGETRLIRAGYGADAIYTRMAMRSLALWRAVCPQNFLPTGVLRIGRDGDPYSAAMLETLEAADVVFDLCDANELARRYPQMRLDAAAYGILERDAGVLMARRAAAAVVEDAVRSGVEYVTQWVGAPPASIRADVLVYACGPWLPKIFPFLLENRIRPTRQEVFFFGPPAADRRFAPENFPGWVDFTDPRGPYGFPDIEGRGVKLAFDRHGAAFDPDTGDRRVSSEGLAEARAFLAERFPDLASAPLTESRVCQYENTSNGDFLIDRHPEFTNVWLVGGGSGHGFKHGPAVGEYLAGLIEGSRPAEPRFSLESKTERRERTVY